ncbi:MAG TPA: hypothetical protein DCQ28_03140 [Bacteroidetes bacterium]|nr:hypothetical protein [Bacteroidota bacterium]
MKSTLAKADIKKIGKILGVEAKLRGNNFRFEMANNKENRQLALEIYPNISIGKKKGNLVSAYTHNTHFQLQFCSGYVVSEDVGEVTFIGETKDKVSAIIVEKEGGCTFYANVDRSILSGDYRMLSIDVMLAGIALSLTQDDSKTKKK